MHCVCNSGFRKDKHDFLDSVTIEIFVIIIIIIIIIIMIIIIIITIS